MPTVVLPPLEPLKCIVVKRRPAGQDIVPRVEGRRVPRPPPRLDLRWPLCRPDKRPTVCGTVLRRYIFQDQISALGLLDRPRPDMSFKCIGPVICLSYGPAEDVDAFS